MNRGEKLLKNTIIISISKICTSLLTFLLLPLYTGILSPEDYGIVDLVNTLIYLMVPIVTLQLEQSVFRDLIEARNNKDKQISIISTGIIQLSVQLFSFVLLFLIIYPFIQNKYKVFLVINLIAYIFVSFFLQIARGVGETRKYALGSFVSAIFTIIFNIIFLVVFNFGAYGMLLGSLIGYGSAIIYLFFSIKLYKYFKISSYKKTLLKTLLKYSIPLVPNALSWWIFNASDRLIVSSILGVSQNGILSASLKFSSIITTLYNIFDTSWIESISANIHDKDIDDFFIFMFNIMINLFASFCLGLISFMPIIFPIMINSNYSNGYGLIPISIISAFLNVIQGMTAVVYAAKKNTGFIAKTSVTAAIINAVVHLLLIHSIGLFAAVISTLVSFIVLMSYRVHGINKNYFKIRFNKKMCLNILFLCVFVCIGYYINNIYLNIISMILTVFYTCISNKNAFKQFIVFFQRKFKKESEEKI